MHLKTVKLASCRFLDALPPEGNRYGQAYRDRGFEAEVLELTRGLGIGAQFGGKYFCHDVRVVRLPRHGASLPIGIGVSCSADRQILGKITADGVFLEELESNPARFLPDIDAAAFSGDVWRPRGRWRVHRTLSRTRSRPAQPDRPLSSLAASLTPSSGQLDHGEGLPDYPEPPDLLRRPANPEGYASSPSGPLYNRRMDSMSMPSGDQQELRHSRQRQSRR